MVSKNASLNKFNLSHGHKTSLEMGYLVPVDFVECLPGDWFRIQNEYLVRFMPTLAPVMHIFDVSLHWWYVPTRLLMDDWQNFITGGKDGTDNTVLPTITSGSNGFAPGSLADHFGMPVGIPNTKVSAFPFRAYNLIYNEWYRNEWLQDEKTIDLGSGIDTTTSTDLLKRCWQRDYFTDCLPSPQKGPAISIGLSGNAPVRTDVAHSCLVSSNVPAMTWQNDSGTPASFGYNAVTVNPDGASLICGSPTGINAITGIAPDNLVADLSQVNAATVNELRQAFAIQRFQETNAIGGNRYVEFVLNHYGVRTPDASLQRPQWVGGSTSPIVISEVLQTSSSTNDSPQGTMAGHGVGAGNTPVINFRSLENGYLMCIMSIMPKTGYFQGLPKVFNKTSRYDFGLPLLAHLGEQAVKNSEIYYQGTEADDEIFGYLPRYEEYRSLPSVVTGQMRTTLDFWHDDRKFSQLPVLNAEFVEASPDQRIFATEDLENDDHIIVQIAHHMKALRPLPLHGTPGYMDH